MIEALALHKEFRSVTAVRDMSFTVGDDANLAAGQRRVGLDAVDERRAARGRGEQALQRDNGGTLPRDHVERAQRLGVREGLSFSEIAAVFEGREVVGRCDEDRRHCSSV